MKCGKINLGFSLFEKHPLSAVQFYINILYKRLQEILLDKFRHLPTAFISPKKHHHCRANSQQAVETDSAVYQCSRGHGILYEYTREQSYKCIFTDSCRPRKWKQRSGHKQHRLQQENLRVGYSAFTHGKTDHIGDAEPTHNLAKANQKHLAHRSRSSANQSRTVLKILKCLLKLFLPFCLIFYGKPIHCPT